VPAGERGVRLSLALGRGRILAILLALLVFLALLILDTTGLIKLAAIGLARLPWYVSLATVLVALGLLLIERQHRRAEEAAAPAPRKPRRTRAKPAPAVTPVSTAAAKGTKAKTGAATKASAKGTARAARAAGPARAGGARRRGGASRPRG
jgi:hypothetical protein